ncbi:MAG: hypothetical protein AAF433_11210 [Bacteroidota bacterium]
MPNPITRKDTFAIVATLAALIALLGADEYTFLSPLVVFFGLLGGFYLLLGLYFIFRRQPAGNNLVINRKIIPSDAKLKQGKDLFEASFKEAKSKEADLHVVLRKRK